MEYAIRQSAALINQGVEVHFLCEETFPKERLAAGIVALEFPAIKSPGWARGKLRTIWMLTFRQRQKSKRIVEICTDGNFDTILFACFKEYFAPFWVGPLRKLAEKGVSVGTIAHDPVRDFVLGPLWWHRWSVLLAYSFVRHVFVHDETPVDFGGKQPKGIQVHQIPHGPYEVAEPKIGRLEMRRRLGFSTTKNTNLHEKSKIIGTAEDEAAQRLAGQARASELGSLKSELDTVEMLSEEMQGGKKIQPRMSPDAVGHRLVGQAGDIFSNPSTSELARNSENTLPTRCASGLAVALHADNMGLESAGGNQLADSKEVLDDQSQAGLQIDSQILQSIHAANDTSASKGHSSSVPIREIRGSNSGALDAGLSTLDSTPKEQVSLLATSYSPPATPASPDFFFLSFGQIRDGKNLDLFLQAMTRLPLNVKLLVGDSGSSKPPEFYIKLAEELGVSHRCRWDIRRIPEDEVGDIFAACDSVLVTYSSKFHSASGVLNTAVSARKPVLASSGAGPLKTAVTKYRLGVFVEPDDLEGIVKGGLKALETLSPNERFISKKNSEYFKNNPQSTFGRIENTLNPDWEPYKNDNSWEENAKKILKRI
ncbi:MAG: glycosyltransferase [Verrucomicrobia bacterium]|nr:glycosyltransferase [Verrucomicrobiota bacterium]